MWKLVSGIALILLLDIAFIFMMASEPDAPEIAQAIGPTAAVPVIHEQPTSPPQGIDDGAEAVEMGHDSARDPRNFRVSKRYASPQTRHFDKEAATVSATAPADLFQDTIIWIGRTEVPVKIDREPVAVRSETKNVDEVQATVSEDKEVEVEVKKRSFRSKAIGVIKKPYDLIKAFADKFN